MGYLPYYINWLFGISSIHSRAKKTLLEINFAQNLVRIKMQVLNNCMDMVDVAEIKYLLRDPIIMIGIYIQRFSGFSWWSPYNIIELGKKNSPLRIIGRWKLEGFDSVRVLVSQFLSAWGVEASVPLDTFNARGVTALITATVNNKAIPSSYAASKMVLQAEWHVVKGSFIIAPLPRKAIERL